MNVREEIILQENAVIKQKNWIKIKNKQIRLEEEESTEMEQDEFNLYKINTIIHGVKKQLLK